MGRKAFVKQLESHAQAGTFHLKDTDGLRWLVYQGRSFEPPWTDKRWLKRVHPDASLRGETYATDPSVAGVST